MKTRTIIALILMLVLLTFSVGAFAQEGNNGVLRPLDSYSVALAFAPNGGFLYYGVKYVDLTLSTSGATTDTTDTAFIPANSIILGVTGTVTTAISGGAATGWAIGDSSTAARFTANNTTLTAGATSVSTGTAWTTGIASATTGMRQGTAAALRITCAGGAPAAGKVRVALYYLTAKPQNP